MRVEQCLLCEDIRHETNNKVSLMGVLERKVKLPITDGTLVMRVALYAVILLEAEERPHSFEFSLEHEGVTIANAIGRTPIGTDKKRVRFAAEGDLIHFPGPGEAVFSILLRSEDGQEIGVVRQHLMVAVKEQSHA
jgi:hypothetical protein